MANRHTTAQAKGDVLAVSTTTTDAPILPVEQIAALQKIAPHRVEWVFDQTQAEAEHRRSENSRVNTLIFAERLVRLLFALIIALAGLGVATYLALQGHEVVASVIGGGTLAAMVTAFVAKKRETN